MIGIMTLVQRLDAPSQTSIWRDNFATSFSHIDEMAVEDATTSDEADMLVERLSAKFPKERIYRSKVSPVIGAHVGPHVLSVAVLGGKE